MDRRQFLGTVGVGMTLGTSGCASDDGDGGDGGGSSADDTDTPTATDEPTETDTPTEEPTDTPKPASFEVVEYGIPETVEIGSEVTLSITIRNTGGQAGSYSAPFYLKTPDSSWEEVGEWGFDEVAPGETETSETTESLEFDYIQRYEFRLGQSSKTAVMQTVSAKLAWGSEFTTPAGYRMRVDEPTMQDSYEYEDYSGNIVEAEPESGGQWAFVNVWVKNETGQANYSPLASDFALLTGNSQFDGETLLLDEPINKEESFDGGELQPEVERSGWVAFELPGNVSVSDLVMAWSQTTFEGDVGVNWGAE